MSEYDYISLIDVNNFKYAIGAISLALSDNNIIDRFIISKNIVNYKNHKFQKEISPDVAEVINNRFKEFNELFLKYNGKSTDEMINDLKSKQYASPLEIAFILDTIRGNKNTLIFFSSALFIAKEMIDATNKIQDLLNNLSYLNEEEQEFIFSMLSDNKQLLDLFNILGFNKLNDLYYLNFDLTTVILLNYYETLTYLLDYIHYDDDLLLIKLKNSIKKIKDYLNTKDPKDILIQRYGHVQSLTLNDIGDMCGLSRERIRQIECKNARKLVNLGHETLVLFFVYFIHKTIDFSLVLSKEKTEFSKTELEVLRILLTLSDSIIRYSNNVNLAYMGELDEKIDSLLMDIPRIVSKEKFEQYDNDIKNIISFKYNYNSNTGEFLYSGVTYLDLVKEIILEDYPDGYNGSNEQKDKITQKLSKITGKKYDLNNRCIYNYLIRAGFISIGSNNFVHKSKLKKLDKGIVEEIINILSSTNSRLYYSKLYEIYKDKLDGDGIKTSGHFKALIDIELPKDYLHTRDFIYEPGKTISLENEIVEFVKSNKFVTMDDLISHCKYAGILPIYNVLSSVDKIIWDGTKRLLIWYDNLGVSEEELSTLKEIVEECLDFEGCNFVNRDKLYYLTSIKFKEFNEKRDNILDSTLIYKIFRYNFENDYKYNSGYISREKKVSFETIVRDYVKNRRTVDLYELRRYLDKHYSRPVSIWFNAYDFLFDDFVIYDEIKFVRKELMGLDKYTLNAIDNEIRYYLTNYNIINTQIYSNYSLFPKLKVKWNKYLLVGIIRTYLNKNYQIEVIEKTQINKDFIIRRK